MRIARLDLFGFKSFPDRTTFHFGGGVSCVVGPNGSGKSNVVDALRWCIGEQSPRSLRGADMSDVIFAGSEDRRPVGFAEVQLTLATGQEQPFPGDYAALSEVQVGRRLHRSGASEYLINQSRVRRKDVVELLMDSGIGNNLYSFIAQGQVDRVITATPEERRAVIDEAAGIARYKARRAEAQGRLQASGAQLDRASDVVDEMQRRLVTLEQQVLRAAEFRRLRTRIRHAELYLAMAKVRGLSEERNGLVAEQRASKGQEAQAREQLTERVAELDGRRQELEVVQAGVATRRDRLAEVDAQIREQEATRRLHEERRVELVREAARASEEVSRAREQLRSAQLEAAVVAEEATSLSDARRELEERAVVVRGVAEEAQAAASEALEAADQAEAALQAVTEQRLKEEATRASCQARVDALGEQIRGAEQQLARSTAAHDGAAQRETVAAEQVPPAQALLTAAQAALVAAEAAYEEAHREQEAAERALGEALRLREQRLDREQAWRAEVQERGRRWLDAAVGDAQATLTSLEEAWRTRSAEAEAAAVARVEAAVEAARHAAQEAAAARVAAADEALAAAGKARDEADASVRTLEASLRELEQQEREAAQERSRAEARLAGARARLSVDDASLKDQPRLLDLVPTESQPALLDRLGERALRPVVRDLEHLVRVAHALEEDVQLQAWFRPEGTVPEVGEAAWLPSLRAALQGVADRRGPAAGPNFRVSADGWVELGTTAPLRSAAEQEQAVLRELEGLEEHGDALSTRRTSAAASLEQARQSKRSAEGAYREAQEAASVERAAAHAEATAAELEAERTVRAEVDEARARREQEREASLAAAVHTRDTSIASARSEVDAISAEITARTPDEEGDARIAENESRTSSARQASAIALTARDAARLAAVEAARSLERAETALAAAQQERGRTVSEGEQRQLDLERLTDERSSAADLLTASEARLTGLTEQEAAARETAGARQADASVAGGAETTATQGVTQVEHELAKLREVGAGLKARQDAAVARQSESEASIGRAQARAGEASSAIETATASRDEAGSLVAKLGLERGEQWDELETERARLHSLQEGVAEVEQALDRFRREVEGLASGHERLVGRLAELGQEVKLIAQRMDDRYQVSVSGLLGTLYQKGSVKLAVDDAVADGLIIGDTTIEPVLAEVLEPAALEDAARVRRTVRSLEADRRSLGQLGEVHLGAIEEYRDLTERHEAMEAQRQDLEESMQSIRAAIERMNALCTERFTDAFAQVRDHFQETYPRLVGGGSARLALSNEDDILESGVEIFVQPPGKRLQNLTLLSGGEKAMTAIALLIALFRVKPSPFCVLDEVDAPLDEANGARFNEMLREMAIRSQFLVITHNRKTMECADTLYGITMARPGVSKLVSVRM